MSKKTKTAYQTIGFWERNRRSQGYLLKKTVRNIVYKIARAALLFGMCFMILQPILNKISISFMAEEDLYNPMIIAIPEHSTKANYELAAQFMSYGTSIINTIVVSLTIAVLQIAVCTLVGYGFARFDFPLKKFWFLCVMLVIVVPPQTISTSLYLHFRYFDLFGIIEAVTGSSLNLRDSVLPYYLMSAGCMGLKNGLYIFMIRQYFRNIPKELEEAAYVDRGPAGFLYCKYLGKSGRSIYRIYKLYYIYRYFDGNCTVADFISLCTERFCGKLKHFGY